MNKARQRKHDYTVVDKHSLRKVKRTRQRILHEAMSTNISYQSLKIMPFEDIDWSAFFTWN